MSKNAIFLQKYFRGNDSSTVLSACQRWASNLLLKVANRKSANSSAIPLLQIRNFLGHDRVRKLETKMLHNSISKQSEKPSSYTIFCTIFNPLTSKLLFSTALFWQFLAIFSARLGEPMLFKISGQAYVCVVNLCL